MHSTLLPGVMAPDLRFPVLGGEDFELRKSNPKNFTVVLFYRGVHCPKCKLQIQDLAEKRSKFEAEGIAIVAVSMDSKERAQRQQAEWGVADQRLGYELGEEQARAWGLYLSSKAKDSEPDLFCEPAIAVLRPDGTIYSLYYQTVPFARPEIQTLLEGLVFTRDNDYPTRGIA